MLLLETRLGDYLLHNAIKIDIYRSQEEKTWSTHLRVDGSAQVLVHFESDCDAYVFCQVVRDLLLDKLCEPSGREWTRLHLDELCEKALEQLTQKGLEE